MVQASSVNAYVLHKESGAAGTQRDKIMILLRYNGGPMTNREIAKCLGIEPSTISARRNELINDGYVKKSGARPCRVTGVTALTWEAA